VALTPWQRRLLDAENDPWRLWFLVITQPPVGVLLLAFAVTERKSPFWVGLLGVGLIALGWIAFKMLGWRAERAREDASKPITHDVELSRDLPNFWAQCACGWMGEDRKSLEPALQDAQDHAGVRPNKVSILDDEESSEVYEVDVSDAEPVVVHDVDVYWDHAIYAPSCSCGWQGTETPIMADAINEARAHGKVEDVEITDIGRPVESDVRPPIEPA
jgi:hypothetical protein